MERRSVRCAARDTGSATEAVGPGRAPSPHIEFGASESRVAQRNSVRNRSKRTVPAGCRTIAGEVPLKVRATQLAVLKAAYGGRAIVAVTGTEAPIVPSVPEWPVPGLTVRPAQLEQVLEARKSESVNAMTEWLMREFPSASANQSEVEAEVRFVAEIAWGWGITSGDLVGLHVYAAKVLGKDYFQAAPGVEAVMSDAELPYQTKHAWLAGWLMSLKQRLDQRDRHP